MDATTIDILTALGEQTAQNFMLRRRVQELEQELGGLYARIEESNQPTPIKQPGEGEVVA